MAAIYKPVIPCLETEPSNALSATELAAMFGKVQNLLHATIGLITMGMATWQYI